MKSRTNETSEKSGIREIGWDRAKVRIAPPVISLAGICIGVVAHFYAAPLNVPGLWPVVRICCGVFLGLGGLVGIWLGLRHFKRTGQEPEPWLPTPVLICQGIYRYSRNPMYVGLALIQCGVGIGTGVFWITAMVLPVMIGVYYMVVKPEEKYLLQKFGEEYLQYKSSVRRWI